MSIYLLNLCVVLALDDGTDTIFGGPKKLVQFDQSTLRQCFICVNIYIGIVIIHGCLLICEYGRFKIDHCTIYFVSLIFHLFLTKFLYSTSLLTCACYHINRFAATLYFETALHVLVKSLMNSVNSLSHLIYVHCFPIVIFQRSKLSHVFHWKVLVIRCVHVLI